MEILWFAACIGVAYYAHSRGRSWILWGLLSVFISPLVAAIILAIMKDKSVDADIAELRMGQQQMHDRISTDEQMTAQRMQQMENALMSHQAQHVELASRQQESPQAIAARPKFCGNCGSPLAAGDAFCPKCGAKVEQ